MDMEQFGVIAFIFALFAKFENEERNLKHDMLFMLEGRGLHQ